MINNEDTHNRIYKIIGVSFLVVLSIYLFLGMFIDDILPNQIFRKFTYIWLWWVLIACSIAFVLEFYYENKKHTIKKIKSTSFKIVSAITAMPILVFTNINIDQFINNYTELDPSLLPNAALALKMIFVPLSWLVILTVILFVMMIKENKKLDKSENEPTLIEVFFSEKKNTAEKKHEAFIHLKNFLRVIGIAGTIYFSVSIVESVQKKNGLLNMFAKALVLNTEYFKSSSCIDLEDYELAADIGRGFISVYHLKTGEFDVTKCTYPVDISS
ncbi:hypothetical protein [Marinicella meishanensis]|uniref:hypothetical protein n=1 Tax=Marinicella meishanensis TaxID=2873263 RepID=UPI001CBD8B1E|nr:hypothetical protein [Marinicella sp. NBU2979]